MTLADPRGRPVDRLRNCYSSWMNTPDAGRIRVRWFRVPDPAPGVYPLTDYSSSNYDPTPHSHDPPVGEESTSRSPYVDYRDCCPPPWPHPSMTDCVNAAGPCFATYRIPQSTWSSDLFDSVTVPAQTLPRIASCRWRRANFAAGGINWTYDLQIFPDQSVRLLVVAGPVFASFRSANYSTVAPADPGGAMTLRRVGPVALVLDGSPVVTVTGSDPQLLLVAPCVWLRIGDPLYLRVGA